jgi:hypothetical protein
MKRANVISGVVLAMFGLIMLVVVIPWQIDAGPQGMVSPRLVPNMMMIVVTALAVLLVITSLSSDGDDQETNANPVSREEFIALLKFGVIFGVALGLYGWVSPLAAGAALVIGALVILGERRPSVILLMPTALLLALWFLFYKVLGTTIV